MKEKLIKLIEEVLGKLELGEFDFTVEHPNDLSHGDYSTNVAMALSKKVGKNPRELAEQIKSSIEENLIKEISAVEVAGSGFINFRLSPEFFADATEQAFKEDDFGKNKNLKHKEIVYEYTDPNPFKQFHIGHLMPNCIGEALSRIAEWNGAKVKRVNYQGDQGLHIAKAIWGMIKHKSAFPHDVDALEDKIRFMGDSYAYGACEYEEDEVSKQEINEINKKLFEKSDHELEIYYEKGRQWSLDHFEEIYKVLGTEFDHYFFESEMTELGTEIVNKNTGTVFEKSDNAVIYRGEQDGLHTRVFINSLGIPTYEAKELGLAFTKEKKYKPDISIVVTANEQKEYFKVVKSALSKIDSEISAKTIHITHGMLTLPSGKMSSRTGQVVPVVELLEDVKEKVMEKMMGRDFNKDEKEKLAEIISVSALKYSILKQSVGRDIVFDFDKSISFEGDSGPYLQYAYTRAKSVLEKAKGEGLKPKAKFIENRKVTDIERLLYRFPEIIENAQEELAPQQIVTYLTEIAGEFNSFYGNEKIITDNEQESEYKLAIASAVMNILKNGLDILGIKVPEKM